jgi:hypothetical protein
MSPIYLKDIAVARNSESILGVLSHLLDFMTMNPSLLSVTYLSFAMQKCVFCPQDHKI